MGFTTMVTFFFSFEFPSKWNLIKFNAVDKNSLFFTFVVGYIGKNEVNLFHFPIYRSAPSLFCVNALNWCIFAKLTSRIRATVAKYAVNAKLGKSFANTKYVVNLIGELETSRVAFALR